LFDGAQSTARRPRHPPDPMPTTRRSAAPDAAPADPVAIVRARADALYRAAVECCRQHDRAAKLSGSAPEPELEHKHLDALCAMCDGSLAELSEAYESAAAHVHVDKDADWWHKANALWHASREYARRHAGCDAMSRRIASKHSAEQLASMQMEYELEASALLALRHAAEAYRKTRPELA
jgi:hypothetical protein